MTKANNAANNGLAPPTPSDDRAPACASRTNADEMVQPNCILRGFGGFGGSGSSLISRINFTFRPPHFPAIPPLFPLKLQGKSAMTRITLAAFLLSGLTASAAMAQTSDYPRVQVQGVPGAASVGTTPGQLLVADPDISTVTVGTTAVNAFAATHVAKGGWIKNPTAAAAALCIRLTGVATTVESAGTTCIPAGQTYQIAAFAGTVSVNATDSAHVFSGQGYQ